MYLYRIYIMMVDSVTSLMAHTTIIVIKYTLGVLFMGAIHTVGWEMMKHV